MFGWDISGIVYRSVESIDKSIPSVMYGVMMICDWLLCTNYSLCEFIDEMLTRARKVSVRFIGNDPEVVQFKVNASVKDIDGERDSINLDKDYNAWEELNKLVWDYISKEFDEIPKGLARPESFSVETSSWSRGKGYEAVFEPTVLIKTISSWVNREKTLKFMPISLFSSMASAISIPIMEKIRIEFNAHQKLENLGVDSSLVCIPDDFVYAYKELRIIDLLSVRSQIVEDDDGAYTQKIYAKIFYSDSFVDMIAWKSFLGNLIVIVNDVGEINKYRDSLGIEFKEKIEYGKKEFDSSAIRTGFAEFNVLISDIVDILRRLQKEISSLIPNKMGENNTPLDVLAGFNTNIISPKIEIQKSLPRPTISGGKPTMGSDFDKLKTLILNVFTGNDIDIKRIEGWPEGYSLFDKALLITALEKSQQESSQRDSWIETQVRRIGIYELSKKLPILIDQFVLRIDSTLKNGSLISLNLQHDLEGFVKELDGFNDNILNGYSKILLGYIKYAEAQNSLESTYRKFFTVLSSYCENIIGGAPMFDSDLSSTITNFANARIAFEPYRQNHPMYKLPVQYVGWIRIKFDLTESNSDEIVKDCKTKCEEFRERIMEQWKDSKDHLTKQIEILVSKINTGKAIDNWGTSSTLLGILLKQSQENQGKNFLSDLSTLQGEGGMVREFIKPFEEFSYILTKSMTCVVERDGVKSQIIFEEKSEYPLNPNIFDPLRLNTNFFDDKVMESVKAYFRKLLEISEMSSPIVDGVSFLLYILLFYVVNDFESKIVKLERSSDYNVDIDSIPYNELDNNGIVDKIKKKYDQDRVFLNEYYQNNIYFPVVTMLGLNIGLGKILSDEEVENSNSWKDWISSWKSYIPWMSQTHGTFFDKIRTLPIDLRKLVYTTIEKINQRKKEIVALLEDLKTHNANYDAGWLEFKMDLEDKSGKNYTHFQVTGLDQGNIENLKRIANNYDTTLGKIPRNPGIVLPFKIDKFDFGGFTLMEYGRSRFIDLGFYNGKRDEDVVNYWLSSIKLDITRNTILEITTQIVDVMGLEFYINRYLGFLDEAYGNAAHLNRNDRVVNDVNYWIIPINTYIEKIDKHEYYDLIWRYAKDKLGINLGGYVLRNFNTFDRGGTNERNIREWGGQVVTALQAVLAKLKNEQTVYTKNEWDGILSNAVKSWEDIIKSAENGLLNMSSIGHVVPKGYYTISELIEVKTSKFNDPGIEWKATEYETKFGEFKQELQKMVGTKFQEIIEVLIPEIGKKETTGGVELEVTRSKDKIDVYTTAIKNLGSLLRIEIIDSGLKSIISKGLEKVDTEGVKRVDEINRKGFIIYMENLEGISKAEEITIDLLDNLPVTPSLIYNMELWKTSWFAIYDKVLTHAKAQIDKCKKTDEFMKNRFLYIPKTATDESKLISETKDNMKKYFFDVNAKIKNLEKMAGDLVGKINELSKLTFNSVTSQELLSSSVDEIIEEAISPIGIILNLDFIDMIKSKLVYRINNTTKTYHSIYGDLTDYLELDDFNGFDDTRVLTMAKDVSTMGFNSVGEKTYLTKWRTLFNDKFTANDWTYGVGIPIAKHVVTIFKEKFEKYREIHSLLKEFKVDKIIGTDITWNIIRLIENVRSILPATESLYEIPLLTQDEIVKAVGELNTRFGSWAVGRMIEALKDILGGESMLTKSKKVYMKLHQLAPPSKANEYLTSLYGIGHPKEVKEVITGLVILPLENDPINTLYWNEDMVKWRSEMATINYGNNIFKIIALLGDVPEDKVLQTMKMFSSVTKVTYKLKDSYSIWYDPSIYMNSLTNFILKHWVSFTPYLGILYFTIENGTSVIQFGCDGQYGDRTSDSLTGVSLGLIWETMNSIIEYITKSLSKSGIFKNSNELLNFIDDNLVLAFNLGFCKYYELLVRHFVLELVEVADLVKPPENTEFETILSPNNSNSEFGCRIGFKNAEGYNSFYGKLDDITKILKEKTTLTETDREKLIWQTLLKKM